MRTLSFRFALALSALLFMVPAEAAAQLLCNHDRSSNIKIPALSVFGGRDYRIQGVIGPADQPPYDTRLLGPIEFVRVPNQMGGRPGKLDRHGNRRGGKLAMLKLDMKLDNVPDPNEASRISESGQWCTTQTPGQFFFRGSFLYDHRYKYDFDWGHSDTYIGARVQADLLPGTGFPVHRVYTTEPAKARQHATELYRDQNANRAMAFYSYEVIMWGRVMRYSSWGTIEDKKGRKRLGPKFSYHFTTEGQIRRRSYMDPRVGIPDSTSSSMVSLNVIFDSWSWQSDKEEEMKKFEKQIIEMCGHPWGCGEPPVVLPPPLGFVQIPGSDDVARREQACRGASTNNANCMSEDNEYVPDTNLTAAALRDVQNNRGVGTQSISEAARTQERTGARKGINGETIQLDSQHGRQCLRLLQRDSLAHFHGPRMVDARGVAQEPGPWLPTIDKFPANCQSSLIEQIRKRNPNSVPK